MMNEVMAYMPILIGFHNAAKTTGI